MLVYEARTHRNKNSKSINKYHAYINKSRLKSSVPDFVLRCFEIFLLTFQSVVISLLLYSCAVKYMYDVMFE